MHSSIFTEIALVLAIGALIAGIVRLLRQPLIIAYILTGLLVGGSAFGLLESIETVELLGQFGVALLLFIVGLGLNPKVVKEVGKPAVLTGLGQVFFTFILGLLLSKGLGFGATESIFIAVGLAFSSTIIILKLLSDKKELNKLHGKIAIGFLLVQDIIATIALLIVSAAGSGSLSPATYGLLLVKGLLLIFGVGLAVHLLIRRLTNFLSQSQELLFLFTLAWGFGVAALFYELGFSLEVGALAAGVSLASMPYAQEVGSRLRPLRDFFIIVFFITLGAGIDISAAVSSLNNAIILSLLVLVGNPIIVMSILGILGYTKKTSFKAGLCVAQISEFSLIFVLLGVTNNLVDESIVPTMMMVAIITITISSYMFIYSDGLYNFFERYLRFFERKKVQVEHEKHRHYDAVLFGYKRGGNEYVKAFSKVTKQYIVIDYDPEAIDELERKQEPYIYGDAEDVNILDDINFTHTKIVVSVITDHETNLFILKQMERYNANMVIICHADTIEQAMELYNLGASLVVLPHYIGNQKVSAFIQKSGLKKSEFKHYREKHISYLQKNMPAI
jgi:Kef-type K+ transport system membrane component KefB